MVPLMSEREAALKMLVERLRWPVKMVRWKAAKAIRSLLMNDETRSATTNTLINWLAARQLESEVTSGLSVLVVSPPEVRPPFGDLEASINAPSMAADFLLNEMYGVRTDRWRSAHSGSAPLDFSPESYFHENYTAQVPPILKNELEYLEERTQLPFLRQWGFEWTALRERLRLGYTRYPTYFGDFSLQREGIFGQFIQRQGELYRSAYQRTLACAVAEWNVPFRAIAPFSAYGVPALPDLFEVDPAPRPAWLPKLDAAAFDGNDLASVSRDLLSREPSDDFQTVLMRIPLDRSLDEFGELELAAFFVGDDFELRENQCLSGGSQILELDRYQFDMVRPPLEQRKEAGKSGSALSVCCNEYPMIHGYWHDEYYQRGLSLPAPYCFQQFTFQRAQADGIYVSIGREIVSSTMIWHDGWTPMYASNSATRCGTITRMRKSRLATAATRLGKKVGWFVRLSRMEKPEGGFDRTPQTASAFFHV
ncbi:hypothetical protein CN150_27875 [Sinorhizobium meliloti]|uniref:hypothetical protein n=1 Tax=Rhizobium meliloti TaxID=382 RepID=UPI000FE090C9|nr:hypothetical protein [Sinorhizobium meliloti]RVK90425.1 hypothetical protein CN150_27875 [Sinorhizobium meliloti]